MVEGRRLVDGRLLSQTTLILALETATFVTGAALLEGERLVAERLASNGPTAETLLPCVDALLSAASVELETVEAFAVSVGPGSFTSLRVGTATAKGLAFGTSFGEEKPIAAVSTLEALAHRVPAISGSVVAMLDARRGEVYAAAYSGDLGRERVLPERVYTPDELCARLEAPLVAIGDGISIAGADLRNRFPDTAQLRFSSEGPSAASVGVLGARTLAAGRAVRARDLVPRYVRRAEAEVQRTGQRFESPI